MKPKLSIGLCIVISVLLVLFGLAFGTLRGYMDDREHVNALLEGENGLLTVLEYRGADGLNLCVVARRHLTDDPDVAALETAANSLRTDRASLSDVKRTDDNLRASVKAVADKLRQAPGFAENARDVHYVDMLSTDLDQLSQNAIFDTYNTAAVEFNEKLDKPVSGFIAKLLGVKPCELYQ